jgi:nitrogen fixation NifU-like protein
MEHFKNPRNVGEMEDADGIGEVGNPQCGDMMKVFIKVKEERIEDIKFQTFGCGAAIAVSSMITEMAKGKTLEEALKIRNRDVAEKLGGLPKKKLHCSNLGADALHQAILNYHKGSSGQTVPVGTGHGEFIKILQPGLGGDVCECPYCDAELPEPAPYCTACGAEIKSSDS